MYVFYPIFLTRELCCCCNNIPCNESPIVLIHKQSAEGEVGVGEKGQGGIRSQTNKFK